MFDFLDIKTIILTVHVLGVVVGMGAALMTDVLFAKSVKNGILEETELSFIGSSSSVVWVGLGLVIASGIVLFSLSPQEYLNSSKFLTKMAVVAVLTINGAFFHFKYLPLLRRQVNKNLATSQEFKEKSTGLFIAGAISSTSWFTAFALGMFRSVPYEFEVIIAVYGLVLLFAISMSSVARKFFLAR